MPLGVPLAPISSYQHHQIHHQCHLNPSLNTLFLLGVKVAYEDVPPLPVDVLELGREGGIIGLQSYPRPSHADVLTVVNHLPVQACNDFDRVSLNPFYFAISLFVPHFTQIHECSYISKQVFTY